MATKFKLGEEVKVASVIPQGPVLKLRMSEAGEFFYYIEWIDVDGVHQERWFAEEQLVKA